MRNNLKNVATSPIGMRGLAGAVNSTVAVVHDDANGRKAVCTAFERSGFAVQSVTAPYELVGLMDRKPVDLVLLALWHGEDDGVAITRELRNASEVGIIHLAANLDPRQRLAALEGGADDYLVLPVEWPEVVARARNLARRVQSVRPSNLARHKTFDGWTLELDKRRLFDREGDEVRLTSAEFELLAVFVSNSGRVLSREFLLEATTRRKLDPLDRTIDTLVRRLRKILEEEPADPRLLTTVHGQGYVFTGDVL